MLLFSIYSKLVNLCSKYEYDVYWNYMFIEIIKNKNLFPFFCCCWRPLAIAGMLTLYKRSPSKMRVVLHLNIQVNILIYFIFLFGMFVVFHSLDNILSSSRDVIKTYNMFVVKGHLSFMVLACATSVCF